MLLGIAVCLDGEFALGGLHSIGRAVSKMVAKLFDTKRAVWIALAYHCGFPTVFVAVSSSDHTLSA